MIEEKQFQFECREWYLYMNPQFRYGIISCTNTVFRKYHQ